MFKETIKDVLALVSGMCIVLAFTVMMMAVCIRIDDQIDQINTIQKQSNITNLYKTKISFGGQN